MLLLRLNHALLRYPFDIPTEAFSFKLFKQAFAAVQASIVHLQGVPLARRFALVPLGPPLLSYSSTCKAVFKYNPATKTVDLVVDKDYQKGQSPCQLIYDIIKNLVNNLTYVDYTSIVMQVV